MEMDFRSGRKVGPKGSVVAGSVWETRIKSDQVKGGFKVFNANHDDDDDESGNNQKLNGVGVSGKRKTWKTHDESFQGFFEKSQNFQIAKPKTEEQSAVVDGIKKTTPVQVKKGRSQAIFREINKSVDGIERNPVHMKKTRSQLSKRSADVIEAGERIELGTNKVWVLGDQKSGNGVSIEENEKIGSEVLADDDDDDEEFYEPEEEEPNRVANEFKKLPEEKPRKVVNEVKKTSQFHNKTLQFSSTVNNQQPPPVVKRATSVYTTTKPTKSPYSFNDYHYQNFPQVHNKLQNLADIVMWRNISKSALIFGMGTFIIILSSYTQDLNISCISVICYLGLVYLAAIFLYRSIICRGVVDIDESSYVVGEEEAVWLLKLVLPSLNEFLLKVRALFTGDPGTTMKLAVLLFVLARCGSYITIWKMAKLGFIGVFTVPKVYSSYSYQLTTYGKIY